MRNFREMIIWNEGIEIVTEVYKLTTLFPKAEEYGLKSQLRRAAVSIPSNIAEGCSRKSQKEFKHYLEISLGSAFEVETDLLIATKLSIMAEKDLSVVLEKIQILERRLNSLISKVNEF